MVGMDDGHCQHCGAEISGPKPWRKSYCSRDCANKSKSSKVTLTCENCDEQFERVPSRTGKFCSTGCVNQFYHTGPDNAQYIDGRDGKRSYGPNWSEQRKKALKRDYHRCRVCNLSDDECQKEYGCELSVHHQTPRRYFEDTKEANRLRNLISVCPPCHMSLEADVA